jgi:thiamine pyrophosphate-dependent acetolactate synthase large subunit-like protein
LLVDVLVHAGVKRAYGVAGTHSTGLQIPFALGMRSSGLRREESAVFAAEAEAHRSGKLLTLDGGLECCVLKIAPVLRNP